MIKKPFVAEDWIEKPAPALAKQGEYVRGNVSTNSIESVWAVMKRGIHGVCHHASKKCLGRYVNEFTFQLNDGNVKRHTLERLNSFTDKAFQARITHSELTP